MTESNSTYLAEIYDNFLSKIADYPIISGRYTDAQIEEQLYNKLKTAIAIFRKCRKPLNIEEDVDGYPYIISSLNQFEIEILTHIMLSEYSKINVFSTEVLKQGLSDKDFKIHSQANQLRELSLLYRLIRKESKKMITEYTYIKIEKGME